MAARRRVAIDDGKFGLGPIGQAAKVRQVGVPSAKVVVIRNAINVDRFRVPDPGAREELQRLFPQPRRLIVCHLGAGCSITAVADGRSVDTSMGFTPLEGLMMGTRSGSIDPGILTYFVRESSMSGEELDWILNRRSGLLGISGVSADMRDIQNAIAQGNERAKLAFDMFVHHLRAGIAAMAGVLGGAHIIVFTAGIGEHSPEVRAAACENLDFMGVKVDAERNSLSPVDAAISALDS